MKKLVTATFLVDVLVIALVSFLIKVQIVSDTRGLLLLWLLPIAFSFHVLEEFVFPGHAEDWFRLYRPRFASRYTAAYFVKVNAIGAVAVALLPLGAFNYRGEYSQGGLRACLFYASIVFFNAIYHIRGTFETRRYSPGLITSLVFYLPLTITMYLHFLRSAAVGLTSALVCFALGSFFQWVLDQRHERTLRLRH